MLRNTNYLKPERNFNMLNLRLSFFLIGLWVGVHIPVVNAQETVKLMHYNLLRYGDDNCGPDIADKDQWLATILGEYKPDIFTVNELSPAEAFSNRIRVKGFNFTDLMDYGEISNFANSSIVNNIFYNSNVWNYDGEEVIRSSPRDINVYFLSFKPFVSLSGDPIRLTIIVAHLKAGDTQGDRDRRKGAAQDIMDWIEENAIDQNVILAGDLNLSNNRDAAFELLAKTSDPAIRLIDPANKLNGWGGEANTHVLTQSTRDSQIDCGITGGLDDRFDLILHSARMDNENNDVNAVPGSYAVFGNDGNSYNRELICGTGGSVSLQTCLALRQMSDHLPVTMELRINGLTTSISKKIPGVSLLLPNQPFSDRLNVSLTNNFTQTSTFKITILNAWGQIVKKGSIHLNEYWQMDTSDWPSGMYILRIEDEAGRQLTRKMQKLIN